MGLFRKKTKKIELLKSGASENKKKIVHTATVATCVLVPLAREESPVWFCSS